jgi:hypothetical protein
MGGFHDAVSTLLETFARGIAIIKTQRRRRERENLPLEPTHKKAESHLSKSLKKNRVTVKDAYGRELSTVGSGFAEGDAEAHSSISAILFRLNAGFVSIIERFTRGCCTSTDYQVLLNLSNASRMEAINTFEALSTRLSRSSPALVPSSPKKDIQGAHRRRAKHSASAWHLKHGRSKSSPELSITPLGPATTEGWVRPKYHRKHSSDSRSSKSSERSSPKHSISKPPSPLRLPASHPPARITAPPSKPSPPPPYLPTKLSKPDQRKSFMSFASDSTKLGEIPEHKWTRPPGLETGSYPINTYYPLEPYREPEKPRSKFMRLFRK